jgi:hypothetical protein
MVRAGAVSARAVVAVPPSWIRAPREPVPDPTQSKRAQCLCASGSVHGGEPGWSGQTRTSRHGRSVCPQRQCCLPAHGTTSVQEIIPQPPSPGKTRSEAVRGCCPARHRQRSEATCRGPVGHGLSRAGSRHARGCLGMWRARIGAFCWKLPSPGASWTPGRIRRTPRRTGLGARPAGASTALRHPSLRAVDTIAVVSRWGDL